MAPFRLCFVTKMLIMRCITPLFAPCLGKNVLIFSCNPNFKHPLRPKGSEKQVSDGKYKGIENLGAGNVGGSFPANGAKVSYTQRCFKKY
jgi:hypothetical protein